MILSVAMISLPANAAEMIIDIDIKPGSVANDVNLNSFGVIPVLISTTDEFDATLINPETAMLEGVAASEWSYVDPDTDGDMDLLVKFRITDMIENTTIEIGDDYAGTLLTFSAALLDGENTVTGTDLVNYVYLGEMTR